MTTSPEYVALEARVTALESDYRRTLITNLAAVHQTVKALVVWSTTADTRLERLEAKVDALGARFEEMDAKLDIVIGILRAADDGGGTP
jgi:uncharacterized coiled-coil protein SlyX